MTQQGWTTQQDLNMDQVSTEPPPPLEAGIYRARVVEATPQPTKKGDPALRVVLQVFADIAGSEISPKRKIYQTAVLTQDAAFRVKQLAVAAGVEPPKTSGFDDASTFAAELTGAEVLCKTKQRQTPDGKTIADVDRFLTAEQAQQSTQAAAPAAPPKRRKAS